MSEEQECPLIPFPGRCVVLREKYIEPSRLIITPEKFKSLPTLGTVVAVGDSDREYLLGKRILFARMSGIPVTLKNQPKYDIFDYSELLCEVPKHLGEVSFEPEEAMPL